MVPAMNFGVVVAMTFDGMFLVVCACGTVGQGSTTTGWYGVWVRVVEFNPMALNDTNYNPLLPLTYKLAWGDYHDFHNGYLSSYKKNLDTEIFIYWTISTFSFLNLLPAQVAAYSDGQVKIFELLDPLELEKWQLQAEFQNVIDFVSKFGNVSCSSASISWNPQRGELQQSSFILGFSSNSPLLNSSKVWEFDQDHQRWLPVAELASPEDKNDQVFAVAWSPNIGRPYELIAVATNKGIAIWHLGTNPDSNGRLFTEKVAVLSGHDGEVWQMEWDMSGMTLASTGSDGMVKLWQSDLNGIWHDQAILAPVFPEQ
ncbi:protein SEH1 [Olea europaea var. sylvestris]|uniref:protein SEH1 n=1 Tax=Olea europaea var. sylvestris TaxID=158386 RepID=UPI000C1D6080|nr:protein SEH1 [Olea europaea var. sylvestris]